MLSLSETGFSRKAGGKEKVMGFAERAAARRKSKDLKNELKELQKQILAGAGGDKAKLAADMKELGAAIELGAQLAEDYARARAHLGEAQASIVRLLDCMAETPAAEVQRSLHTLMGELEQIYHDCAIREDDLDFRSTFASLKRLSANYGEQTPGMERVMLRSELENVKAVLDDTVGWEAPDFLALGYYCTREGRDTLRDMENEQRNQFVLRYWKEHLLDALMEQCSRSGALERMQELLQKYIPTEN